MAEDLYGHLRERGNAGWEKVMGSPNQLGDAAPGSFSDLTQALVFGDLWQRPQLTQRERRLVVLTIVAMVGREVPLLYHLDSAIATGDLDHDDLDEMALTLAFYAGWPIGSTFNTAAQSANPTSQSVNTAAPSADPGGNGPGGG